MCWGLEEEEARRFVEDLVRMAPQIQFSPLTTMETEELEFVIDPAEYVALALISCVGPIYLMCSISDPPGSKETS